MSPLNGVNALNWVPIFTLSVRNMGLHAPLPPTFTPATAMRGGTHNYSKFTLIRSFRPFPWITPLTMCHDPFGATRIIAAPYITMPSYNYKLDEIGYGRPGERERDLAVEPGRTPPMPRRNVAAIDILMRFHFFPFPPGRQRRRNNRCIFSSRPRVLYGEGEPCCGGELAVKQTDQAWV